MAKLKNIQDLSSIVTKRKNWSSQLPKLSNPKTKVDQLITYLQGESDQMAAAYDAPHLSSANRMLKSRAKRRLLNTLFFLKMNAKKHSPLAVATLENQRYMFWMKVLLLLGARLPAIQLARKGLIQAEKFNFTSNALEFAIVIRRNAALHGERAKLEEANFRVITLMKTYEAETIAEYELDRLSMRFAKSTAEQPSLALEAQKSKTLIEQLLERSSSYALIITHFRITVYLYQISQQYRETVEVCNEMEDYFQNYSHLVSPTARGGALLYKLESLIYLKELKQAKQVVEATKQYFPKGRNNWFIMQELAFLLSMQEMDFVEAETILKEVTRHPRFALQPTPHQEKWEVFQLYLNYALKKPFNKWQASFDAIRDRVPIYSKDKKGLNVAILIIHVLFLLRSKQLDKIVLRMEALQTYRHRYLAGSTNHQSAIFIKLLRIIERESFDKDKILLKSRNLVAELEHAPTTYFEMKDGIQILPYEWLWKCALEDLDNIQRK